MFDWLRRLKPEPLTGAPITRREKSYPAGSGYVYHYFFNGHRPCRGGAEYDFDVSADRRTFRSVSVFLSDATVAPWQAAHGRDLAAVERYAVIKLALLRAFDESPSPAALGREVRPAAHLVAEILETLGID